MTCDVFISYSHHDKSTADAICSRLERDRLRCWYAPRDIRPGDDWAQSIMEAIESARVMVLVFTDQSNISRQVLNEISNAVNTDTVIVPFRLTESEPSKSLQYYFSAVHWLDAVDTPLEDGIEKLNSQIHRILEDKPVENPPSAPAKETGKRRKWLIPAVSALLLAALAFVIWFTGGSGKGGNVVGSGTAEQTQEEKDEYYTTGVQMLKNGQYYQAYRNLSMSKTAGAADMAELCLQPLPEDGEIWRDGQMGEEGSEVLFTVRKPEDEIVLIVVMRNGVVVSALFVNREDSVSVLLPYDDYYSFWYIHDRNWFGLEDTIPNADFEQILIGESQAQYLYNNSNDLMTIPVIIEE